MLGSTAGTAGLEGGAGLPPPDRHQQSPTVSGGSTGAEILSQQGPGGNDTSTQPAPMRERITSGRSSDDTRDSFCACRHFALVQDRQGGFEPGRGQPPNLVVDCKDGMLASTVRTSQIVAARGGVESRQLLLVKRQNHYIIISRSLQVQLLALVGLVKSVIASPAKRSPAQKWGSLRRKRRAY
jgi:hypothetical protein